MKKIIILLVAFVGFAVYGQDSTLIYKDNSVLRFENVDGTRFFIAPNAFNYRIKGNGDYIVRDGIYNQEYNIGTYAEIYNVDTVGFASQLAVINYLNKFVNYSFAQDKSTGVAMNIDYAHHEIHEGDHYFFSDKNTINSGDSIVYLITTPDTTKWSHFILSIDGSAITQYDVYEGTDKVGTTFCPNYNNNRNVTDTSGIVIYKGVSGGTTDGTLLRTHKAGSASGNARTPMTSRSEIEMLLKQNTKYQIIVISGTASNLTNVVFTWYDHEDKF